MTRLSRTASQVVGNSLPLGEKATELTEPKWPLSVCSAAPVVASQSRTVLSSEPDATTLPSQSRTVLSSEPDATTLPSGEKATDVTDIEWPSSVCSAAPVVASQSRTVLSPEPDATTLPSREKATDVTEPE
ncbi:hypothetical protein V500_10208 [Pseudogymnoascus sp. VKM F-4518 (FW-2643)]|nr:hypothetical protein V500_10208 [Pseudogymnoascus sp. VKM F-4518 (FW-2643)]